MDVGANMLAGTGSQRILDGAMRMRGKGEGWKNPFGEGTDPGGLVPAMRIESAQFSQFASIRFIIRLPVPQRRCYDCHHLYK